MSFYMQEGGQAAMVAWFVSLIPRVPANAYFPGLTDIWPTSEQVLSMMAGSEAEHAVLLANYLTGLGRTAYLVLGRGVPEGRTAYVLTVEENGHWLWNAVTGERFSTNETFLPLSAVHCVVSGSNMWANLQAGDSPARLRWQLNSSTDWLPLFSSGAATAAPPSLQPDRLALSPADHRGAKQLKERIEKTLRNSLMNLRKKINMRTSLNFQGKAVLAKLLPGLEAARLSPSPGRALGQEHLAELQRIMASHKLCGFPLHFAYSDLESIVEAVRGTGVHLCREPGAEFALAVAVEPYPATAMSVWVYVASMVRRR